MSVIMLFALVHCESVEQFESMLDARTRINSSYSNCSKPMRLDHVMHSFCDDYRKCEGTL